MVSLFGVRGSLHNDPTETGVLINSKVPYLSLRP